MPTWTTGGWRGIPQAGATPRTERSSGSCVPRRRSSGSIVPRRRSRGPAATPPARRTETPAVDGWVVVCTDAAQHSGPQQHRCVSRARVPSRTDATRGVLCGYSGTRVGRSYSHEEEGAVILAQTCAAWANRIRTRARHGSSGRAAAIVQDTASLSHFPGQVYHTWNEMKKDPNKRLQMKTVNALNLDGLERSPTYDGRRVWRSGRPARRHSEPGRWKCAVPLRANRATDEAKCMKMKMWTWTCRYTRGH